MIEKKAIFGGEENGGFIYPKMQYCRDSLMTIGKIMEIMSQEDKTLSELIDRLPKYEVFKTKIACPNEKKTKNIGTTINKSQVDFKCDKDR